jgi:hypothetical protein
MAPRNPLTKSKDDRDDNDAGSDGGAVATQDEAARNPGSGRVSPPDVPGDAPATEGSDDQPQRRDAISHNLLGTPRNPVDPISHNPIFEADAYEGKADLDVGSILDDEDDLKAQLRALSTERLHILYHAVQGESASR